MADSLSLGGASPVVLIAACWLSFQLSLDAIRAPLPAWSSNVGSANAPVMPNWLRVGPRARSSTVLLLLPPMLKPAMSTLLAVCTSIRVEMLNNCPPDGVKFAIKFRFACKLKE